MNDYEIRQEEKRKRLLDRADKRRSESSSLYKRGREALDAIPMGQPILADHYSAKSDRSYRNRAIGRIEKSFVLGQEASELERRAGAVGSAGVSSDDPEAVQKLAKQLAQYESLRSRMVNENAAARKSGQPKPFQSFQVTNVGASIRRLKKRIEELQSLRDRPLLDSLSGEGWEMCEDKEENRIILIFKERQPEEVVRLLRSFAFLWSPSRKAWVRKITPNALAAARHVAGKLPVDNSANGACKSLQEGV